MRFLPGKLDVNVSKTRLPIIRLGNLPKLPNSLALVWNLAEENLYSHLAEKQLQSVESKAQSN